MSAFPERAPRPACQASLLGIHAHDVGLYPVQQEIELATSGFALARIEANAGLQHRKGGDQTPRVGGNGMGEGFGLGFPQQDGDQC